MEDKLKKEVEAVVTAIFASKEQETIRQKTEDALNDSAAKIEELTTSQEEVANIVVTQETTIADLEKSVEKLEIEKATIVEANEASLKELADAKEVLVAELEAVALELSTMKKEINADSRMAELTTAGVVREASDVQRAKVMDMSDEDFASYKEELVSIKAQVIESLKGQEEASTELEDDNTPPANVDPTKTAQAALNLESQPSQDLAKKYADLGKAMADAIKNK